MADVVEGGCFCGGVEFELELPVTFCVHCHCSMCRRVHGSAYVTWVGIPRDRFRVTRGRELLGRHGSSDHGVRSFCSRCGTPMLCESSRRPDEVDVTLSSLHGPAGRAPEAHVWFDHRADWVRIDDGLPRLGGETGMEPVDPG